MYIMFNRFGVSLSLSIYTPNVCNNFFFCRFSMPHTNYALSECCDKARALYAFVLLAISPQSTTAFKWVLCRYKHLPIEKSMFKVIPILNFIDAAAKVSQQRNAAYISSFGGKLSSLVVCSNFSEKFNRMKYFCAHPHTPANTKVSSVTSI